jgi:hypothetical protein
MKLDLLSNTLCLRMIQDSLVQIRFDDFGYA